MQMLPHALIEISIVALEALSDIGNIDHAMPSCCTDCASTIYVLVGWP